MPGANAATTPLSIHKAMEQMGKVLRHIVAKVETWDSQDSDIFFAKWDTKDGFWRLVIAEEENAQHFCYVLPQVNKDDPIQIAHPTCLQMGWCKSPLLFCMASEMARDIAQELADKEPVLQAHLLEHLCLPEQDQLPPLGEKEINCLMQRLEIY